METVTGKYGETISSESLHEFTEGQFGEVIPVLGEIDELTGLPDHSSLAVHRKAKVLIDPPIDNYDFDEMPESDKTVLYAGGSSQILKKDLPVMEDDLTHFKNSADDDVLFMSTKPGPPGAVAKFEIPGFGSITSRYHRIIRAEHLVILVYNENYAGDYFTPQSSGSMKSNVSLTVDGSGIEGLEQGSTINTLPTGVVFKVGSLVMTLLIAL